MSIPVHNVSYYYGDTYTLVVNFSKSDGTPVDLSTGTLVSWIVSDPAHPASTHITSWQITKSTSIVNQATMKITPTIGALLNPTLTYYYDVEFKVTSTNDVTTFFAGNITIEPDRTNSVIT